MPDYPVHYLLSYGGPLRTDEIWNQNLRFITQAVMTSTDQEEALPLLKTAIQAWGAATGSRWSSSSQLAYVKFNRIDSEGHYFDTTTTHRLDFTPANMGTVVSPYPNQIALVISWRTDFARGPASKGRVFMPTPDITLDTATGRVGTSTVLGIANAAAAFLNAANTAVGTAVGSGGAEASVVSGIDSLKARISGVRVGNVLDTQRRRRNALPEVYSNATTVVVDT